jgi:hypothetical protein
MMVMYALMISVMVEARASIPTTAIHAMMDSGVQKMTRAVVVCVVGQPATVQGWINVMMGYVMKY